MVIGTDYEGIVDRPLFGETRYQDRVSFLIVTIISTIFVITTFVSVFAFGCFKVIYLLLSLCLFLLLGSHIFLAFWYRSGDLEPRFRNLLYYNTTALVFICICSNVIFNGHYSCKYEHQCTNSSGKLL